MKHWSSSRLVAGVMVPFLIAAGSVAAADHALAGPTVDLHASVSSGLPNDEMVVLLAVERTGASADKLNEEVLGALNLALAKAKTVAGVGARLGPVTTQPEWSAQGKRTGWTVRGVVVLEGRDLKATGTLAGEMSSDLQIAGVSFRLTDQARRQEESRLIKDAASAFNQRALETATAFGFAAFELKKLSVDHGSGSPPRPMQMEVRAASASARAFVPTEGGDSTVTLTISGSVELK